MDDLISRQAAIDFIDAGHFCNPNEPRWSDNEIINFLKSRPSAQRDGTDTNVGGTIYRQAAIDAMCGACSDWCDEGVCKKVSAIQKLPSAQPERPRGEWINRSLNILYPDWERYTCSACGKHAYNYDFCPNCGADMRGETK